MTVINFIKDLGPVIIATLALFFADRHITKQAKLSIKAKWIEEFRSNTVKLLTRHFNFLRSYQHKDGYYSMDAYTDFLEQISLLRILLKKNIPKQKELYDDLNSLTTMVKEVNLNMTIISNKIGQIYNKCEGILENEENSF